MHSCIFIVLVTISTSHGWRAVPANQASFANRRVISIGPEMNLQSDELLPRTSLHSVFKFGWCRPDSLAKVYLRKTAMIHLPNFQSAHLDYIYLLETKNTQRFRMQCVVLKIMVPLKYLFRRSRLPLYYCQGTLFYVVFNMIQRMEVHELFLHTKLNMPADFHFEFYHPPSADTLAKEIFKGPYYY